MNQGQPLSDVRSKKLAGASFMAVFTESRGGLLLVMLAAALWGTVGVTTKSLYVLSVTNPLSVGFFRLALSAPALLAACWLAIGARTFAIARRDVGAVVMIGAMMALYQACYFAAIPRVGVAIATLITLCTAPVIVAALSALFMRERLTRTISAAMICALAGTTLLVGIAPGAGPLPADAPAGVLLALGSATAYAVLTLCSRQLANRYHPLQPIAIGFTLGALALGAFAMASPGGLVASYPTAGWLRLLYLGLVPTAFGYFAFLAGMRTTPATVATIATLVEPLTSTFLAWLLFDEQLGPTGWLGALLLLAAMIVLYRKGR
ncbi:DMT family transporter [Candidatus Roseilinea sp. NK_OTU-006]|jgi:DME family drug/metabolite transporter|nr:EamA family transporter [Candidatus Roseilinea sp. NK_OTU-006]